MTFYASVERKFQRPGYETETVTMGISQVPFDIDEESLSALLDRPENAVNMMRDRLRERVADVRRERPRFEPPAPPVPAANPETGEVLEPNISDVTHGKDVEAKSLEVEIPEASSVTENLNDNGHPATCFCGDCYDPFDDDNGNIHLTHEHHPDCRCGDCNPATKELVAAAVENTKSEPPKRGDLSGYYCETCQSTSHGVDHCLTCSKQAAKQAAEQPVNELEIPAPDHHPANELEIPADDQVQTDVAHFGVTVPIPPLEWALEPITKEGGDSDGGQLKALNTVLGLHGYSGKDRHWGALAILQGFNPMRSMLDSLNDLTKAEAHYILSWFDGADEDAFIALHDAAARLKGQIPLFRVEAIA